MVIIRPYKDGMRPYRLIEIVAQLILIFFLITINESYASEKVLLQLAWKHQFQFAGYYAALHEGYYQKAGLDVVIVEGGEGKFAREEVLSGRARFGVAGAELILHRLDGDPFVVLASVFQHSPSILLARRDSGITNLQDLIGKRVMLLPENKDADILAAFLNEGIPLHSIRRLDQTYDLDDLIEGRVDAVSAYLTNEPWQLTQKGIEPAVINPQTYGVDFYSDCLFTTENEIEENPQRVQDFLEASLLGWEYAMAHPQEIIELLVTEYGVKKSPEHLLYEAESIRQNILPSLVRIGHMNPGRWNHIAKTYQKLGMIDGDFSLEGFLYDPDPGYDYARLKRMVFAAMATILFLGIGAAVLFFFNRKLRTEVVERRQAEKALRESKEQIGSIFRSAPVGIGSVDNRILKNVNSRLCEMTGYDEDELIGQSARVLYSSDEEFEFVGAEKYAQIIACGTGTVETRWRRKDGTIIDVLLSSSAIDLQNPSKTATFTALDITERKLAEKALKESEEKLKAILEAAPDPIIVYDGNGYPQYLNPAFNKLFGWKREELMECVIPFVPEDQKELTRDKIRELYEYGTVARIETKRLTKEGTVIDVLVSGSIIKGPEGTPSGVVVCLVDIRKTRELEEQVRHSHKMDAIGTLSGGIAHEFNNMLGVIMGNAELAIDDIPEWNPAAECIEEIRKASLRAKDVVRKLLSIAHKTPESRKPIQIRRTVKESLDLLRKMIPSTIEIRSDLACTNEMILADPTEINQVLMNLCTNSVHAMTDGKGALEVTLEFTALDSTSVGRFGNIGSGDYAQITFADDGNGIAAGILDRIFDPYFTTKNIDEGLGMGLAVVHGIVKRHEGAIRVESEVGKGTTVEVLFPLIEAEPAIETEKIEAPPTGTETILLVDDEASLVRMVAQMLKRSGYEVVGKTSSADALELLKENPGNFDLVITDMAMPEISGDRFAQKIMQICPNVPVIICTGHSDRMDENKAKELGIKAFVMKPLGKIDLITTVRKVIDEAKGQG